jgi:hypothetical protein
MQITIKRNIAQELECFKIKTDLLTRNIRAAIVFFIFGVVAIIVCQQDFGVTDTSLFVYCLLEFMFFVVSYGIFKAAYNYKKSYKTFYETAVKDYADIETYSTVTINDEYFCYESLNKYYKLSWRSLAMYRLYNGNLVLIMDSYITAFIIRPQDLSPSEFQELYMFASKNLKLRKK